MKYPVKVSLSFDVEFEKNGSVHVPHRVQLFLDVPEQLYFVCYEVRPHATRYTGKGNQIVMMAGIEMVASAILSADLDNQMPKSLALEQSIDLLQKILNVPEIKRHYGGRDSEL